MATAGAATATSVDVRKTGSAPPRRSGDLVRGGGLLAALALLAVMILLSIAIGARSIPLGTSWHLLWNDGGSTPAAIIHDLRIPRMLIGPLIIPAGRASLRPVASR